MESDKRRGAQLKLAHNVFYAGKLFSGELHWDEPTKKNHPRRLGRVSFSLAGYSHSAIGQWYSAVEYGGRQLTKHVKEKQKSSQTNIWSYFEDVWTRDHSQGLEENGLMLGYHYKFPFSVLLPQHLPPSFKIKHGRVYYKLIVDVLPNNNLRTPFTTFTYNIKVENLTTDYLRSDLLLVPPPSIKVLKSKIFEVNLQVGKSYHNLGTDLEATFMLSNISKGKQITKASLSLVQKSTARISSDFKPTKTERTIGDPYCIVDETSGPLAPGSTIETDLKLKLPLFDPDSKAAKPLTPSVYTDWVDLTYTLVFRVDVKRTLLPYTYDCKLLLAPLEEGSRYLMAQSMERVYESEAPSYFQTLPPEVFLMVCDFVRGGTSSGPMQSLDDNTSKSSDIVVGSGASKAFLVKSVDRKQLMDVISKEKVKPVSAPAKPKTAIFKGKGKVSYSDDEGDSSSTITPGSSPGKAILGAKTVQKERGSGIGKGSSTSEELKQTIRDLKNELKELRQERAADRALLVQMASVLEKEFGHDLSDYLPDLNDFYV